MVEDLNTVANVAEIIGALVVVGGAIFAIVQIRDFRRQRHDLATIEVVRTFQSPELNRAYRILQALPDGFSIGYVGKSEAEVQDAILLVATTYESLGVLVNRRVVSLSLVGDLMGGAVETSWAKIKPFALELRDATSRPKTFEWFQSLAEQILESRYSVRPPAYTTHSKPPRAS